MECVLYCIELWLLSSRAVTLSTYCLYVVAPWSLNFWYLLQELILTFLFIHSLFNILLLHKCSFQSSPSPSWTRQIVATTTGSESLSFDPFRILKTVKMAMFEVIPRASWRSNSGSEPLFTSELTQILKIWSQKFFFPLGSLEDGHVPERRILPQFQNKAL